MDPIINRYPDLGARMKKVETLFVYERCPMPHCYKRIAGYEVWEHLGK